MMKDEIDYIMADLEARGVAFVDDEYLETDEGPVYNPLVDKVNPLLYLRDQLEHLVKHGKFNREWGNRATEKPNIDT